MSRQVTENMPKNKLLMWVEGALTSVKLLPRERMALSDPILSPNSSHGMNPLTIVTKFGYLVTKCSQIFPMK